MITEFHIKANDLNEQFLSKLKKMFKNKHISITVEEVDETDYLLQNPANKDVLLKSLKSSEKGNLTEIDIDKYLSKK